MMLTFPYGLLLLWPLHFFLQFVVIRVPMRLHKSQKPFVRLNMMCSYQLITLVALLASLASAAPGAGRSSGGGGRRALATSCTQYTDTVREWMNIWTHD
jgi:hypothetical protein